MKRLFDLVVSLAALSTLMPLMVVVAIIIKLDSKGPVFFRQDRVGLNGETFSIYKFRSMADLQSSDVPYNTRPNDPRITAVGRFIRATSIDEIPQLLNVLFGEMSIVGPRPDLEIQQKDYEADEWRVRHTVSPGITGLAQVNGRSKISFADRIRHDLYYARHHDISLDIKIILRTFKIVFSGRDSN
jgi:lipopolysaccharide/colanic/teichoic acid biosynthesis glycosyltransferase